MHYLRQADCETVEEEHDEIRKRDGSDSEGRKRREMRDRDGERRGREGGRKRGEGRERGEGKGGISKERELGPKLGCNYSRLPYKLSSCHSYLPRWIQLR